MKKTIIINKYIIYEKIEELKKLYKETKISYTEKEKELEDTERRKQEEENKYKDLEVQYTKIHKEFIKENHNLIFDNDDVKTILKNIKKLKNFNLSGKVKKNRIKHIDYKLSCYSYYLKKTKTNTNIRI